MQIRAEIGGSLGLAVPANRTEIFNPQLSSVQPDGLIDEVSRKAAC